MDRTFSCILLLLGLSAALGKYVYIQEKKTRSQALEYCQKNHTDLAPVSNDNDIECLKALAGSYGGFIWIGLERNSIGVWMWSGGGAVSTSFWDDGQPNSVEQIYGVMKNYLWHDIYAHYRFHFFCYNVNVVQESKTWEQALEHCREHHKDLSSVASDTEMMLIHKELEKYHTTKHVWIGLRLLQGNWLWIDGQPWSYEAWGPEGEPVCSWDTLRCGALQVMGRSTEKLVWQARDCAERLSFICY